MPGDAFDLTVTVKGPLFSEKVDAVIKAAVIEEVLDKVEERVLRSPSRRASLGRRNNTIGTMREESGDTQELTIDSTRVWPRTKGGAWFRYNARAIRKLAPNVIRKATRRIVEDLGG